MNQEVMNFFNPQAPAQVFDSIRISLASPGQDSVLVVRRDQEAGDDQLPHVQARARRPVLRAHLWPDQGLRVPVRQVQAHEVQGRHLRKVRRRSDAVARSPRAHGPYRAGRSRRPHLVPEVAAVAHRHAARHDAEGHRARPLLRELHRHRARPHRPEGAPAAVGGRVHASPSTSIGEDQLHRHDRRRGHPRPAGRHGPREDRRRAALGTGLDHVRAEAEEAV